MGRRLIPGTIWKISCHKPFITYFTLTFSKHWLLYCKKDLWTDKLRKWIFKRVAFVQLANIFVSSLISKMYLTMSICTMTLETVCNIYPQYLDVLSDEIEKNLYKICILYIYLYIYIYIYIPIFLYLDALSGEIDKNLYKICIKSVYRFYTDFSLFRQIKRQDTVIYPRRWHLNGNSYSTRRIYLS